MPEERANGSQQNGETPSSCDSQLTRKEFLKHAAKYAAAAGLIAAAPKILDKFLVPPVYALGTRMSAPGSASDYPSGYGSDTSAIQPSS